VTPGVRLIDHSGLTIIATITLTSTTSSTDPSSIFLATMAPPIPCHG
jgi:hypothetical protein